MSYKFRLYIHRIIRLLKTKRKKQINWKNKSLFYRILLEFVFIQAQFPELWNRFYLCHYSTCYLFYEVYNIGSTKSPGFFNFSVMKANRRSCLKIIDEGLSATTILIYNLLQPCFRISFFVFCFFPPALSFLFRLYDT